MGNFIEKEEVINVKIDNTIFPDEHKYLTFLKKVFRHEFRKNGFRRISTLLHEKGVLRTNSELGIMQSYIDNNINEDIQPVYYYYMGYFFGSGNEEHRIGGEVIGEDDPILDAMLIYIVYTILNKIGLENDFSILINSSGIEKEKVKFKAELEAFYENKKHLLSEESLKLLETNPIMLLASQNEDEKILTSQAPNIQKFLKKDSKAHYAKFKEYLELLNIPFIESNSLISEKSYVTNSIWEIKSNEGKIISKGSRYNALAKDLGSQKDIPATGFYSNPMVIIDMIKEKDIKIKNKDEIDLFIVQLGDEAKKVVLPISLKARDAGINTVVSLGTPSMKEQMLKAGRSGSRFVVMVGIMEARNGNFQIRDMDSGTQEEVKKENLIDYVISHIGTDKLDFYCPARDLISD